jgi:hypothetical protein
MKDHRHVGLDPIDEIDKVVGRVAGSHDSIERFPKDQRTRLPLRERGKAGLGSDGRAFEQKPSAVGIRGQRVEVPSQARVRAIRHAGYGEPAALRERRSLQTHAETAEVVRIASVEGVFVAEPHRTLKRGVVHASAVVESADAAC